MKNNIDKDFTTIYSKEKVDYVRELSDKNAYDEYRKIWDNASNLDIIPNFPPQIDFELNYSCNLSCINCTWNLETTKKNKETWFPFEVYKEIIDESVKKGLKSIRLNYLNEPLMRKDISKFIEYAKNSGVLDIYFSTNGMLLTDKLSKEIIKSGLTRIQISIDANTKETYNKIRIGGNLDKIKKNIENFIKIKKELNVNLPTIRVNFVKTSINQHELEDFINYWTPLVDSVAVQNLIGIVGNQYNENKNKKPFNCNHPFKLLVIRYDGTILPCCSFFGAEIPVALLKTNIPLSTVNNIGLKKQIKSDLILKDIETVWNSEEMNFLRKIHKNGEYWKNKICDKCINS